MAHASVIRVYDLLNPKPKELIQDPHRRLVREGDMKVYKAESKKPSDYHLFLFNDVLLLAKKDGKKYWLRIFCNLSSGNRVEDVKDSSYHIPNVEFRLYSPRKTIIFFAATSDEKQMWIKEIQMAVASNTNRGLPGGDDRSPSTTESSLSKPQTPSSASFASQHTPSPPTSQNQFSQPQHSLPQHSQPQYQPQPQPQLHQPQHSQHHHQPHHHHQPQPQPQPQQHAHQQYPAQQPTSAPASTNDDDFFGEFVAKRAQSNAPKPIGLQSMGMAGQLLQGNTPPQPQPQPPQQGFQPAPNYASGIGVGYPPQGAGLGYPQQVGGMGVQPGLQSAGIQQGAYPTGVNPYASQGYTPSMAGQLMSAHSAAAPQVDGAAKERDVVFM